MSVDPYLAFVGFYNDWSPQMEGDIEFYTKLALDAGGPIVELGVGAGRIAIPISLAGVDVIGVDVSEAMLTEGKRRAEDAGVGNRITWMHEDMKSFVADPPVGLVTIPFRSFLHMATTDDQLGCLASARRSLRPGGRLALNVFVPDPEYIVGFEGKRRLIDEFTDEHGRRNELWHEPRYEIATQALHLKAMCDTYEGDRLVDVQEAFVELRMIHRYEMEHLLIRAGFEIEALYGWFDERPFTQESREMVWVART
ncbi:MAG: class I SAM-dependent methyltransferase [Actinomycetota bacterium]|nr:class I SAM-dependent methyltransferase [Actinomycetota bacterium]